MLSKSALAAAHCSSHRTSQTCSLDVPASCPHDEYVFEDRFEDGEEGPPVPVCLRCGLMDARILGSCFEKQHVFRPGAIECQCGRWPESEECTHRFDGESACVLCGIIANQQQMDQLVPTRPVEVLELEARIRPALRTPSRATCRRSIVPTCRTSEQLSRFQSPGPHAQDHRAKSRDFRGPQS